MPYVPGSGTGTSIKQEDVEYSSVLTIPAETSVKVIVTSPMGKRKMKYKFLEVLSKTQDKGRTDGIRGEFGSTIGIVSCKTTGNDPPSDIDVTLAFAEWQRSIIPTRINAAIIIDLFIKHVFCSYKVISTTSPNQEKSITIVHRKYMITSYLCSWGITNKKAASGSSFMNRKQAYEKRTGSSVIPATKEGRGLATIP